MEVIFFPGKHSRFIRVRNREKLSPAHCNELVKEPKTMFWGRYSLSVVASLRPVEGMMNLYKYIEIAQLRETPFQI